MEIVLNSHARKIGFFGLTCLLAIVFLTASSLHWLASRLAREGRYLELATRLEPGSALYHELLGRQLLRQRGNVQSALSQYWLAATLNPYDSAHWMAIADAEQILNDVPAQRYALQRALASNPTTPHVAWSAGNFFLAQGDEVSALHAFKVVLENDPGKADQIFALASHVANVPQMISGVLPPQPTAYLSLLNYLIAQKDTSGATQVWDALTRLGQTFEPGGALAYVDYLLVHHEVAAARQAWSEAAQLCGLSAYLPSSGNRIVNPNFDSGILNSGFDWRYQRKAHVEIALDAAEVHQGHRCLSIAFDGPGVDDAGIAQFLPLEPNTGYEFSADYKAAAMDGAGGARLSIQDAYMGVPYFSSDDLRGAEAWHQISGTFRTGADAQLAVLRVARVPAGSPIRGKLWIDNLRFIEKETQ